MCIGGSNPYTSTITDTRHKVTISTQELTSTIKSLPAAEILQIL